MMSGKPRNKYVCVCVFVAVTYVTIITDMACVYIYI